LIRVTRAQVKLTNKEILVEFFDEYLKILNLGESEEPVLRTVQSFRPKSGKIQ
jgi:hypothetical protein